jgi:hypothetical protein
VNPPYRPSPSAATTASTSPVLGREVERGPQGRRHAHAVDLDDVLVGDVLPAHDETGLRADLAVVDRHLDRGLRSRDDVDPLDHARRPPGDHRRPTAPDRRREDPRMCVVR